MSDVLEPINLFELSPTYRKLIIEEEHRITVSMLGYLIDLQNSVNTLRRDRSDITAMIPGALAFLALVGWDDLDYRDNLAERDKATRRHHAAYLLFAADGEYHTPDGSFLCAHQAVRARRAQVVKLVLPIILKVDWNTIVNEARAVWRLILEGSKPLQYAHDSLTAGELWHRKSKLLRLALPEISDLAIAVPTEYARTCSRLYAGSDGVSNVAPVAAHPKATTTSPKTSATSSSTSKAHWSFRIVPQSNLTSEQIEQIGFDLSAPFLGRDNVDALKRDIEKGWIKGGQTKDGCYVFIDLWTHVAQVWLHPMVRSQFIALFGPQFSTTDYLGVSCISGNAPSLGVADLPVQLVPDPEGFLAGAFFDTASLELEPIKPASPAHNPKDRDSCIYKWMASGMTLQQIKNRVNKNPKWESLETLQAVSAAGKRFALKHRLTWPVQR